MSVRSGVERSELCVELIQTLYPKGELWPDFLYWFVPNNNQEQTEEKKEFHL